MENVNSLFTKKVWAKLETNEKLIAMGKQAKNVVIVPEFDISQNGEVSNTYKFARITTSEQAREYDRKYAKVLDMLKEKYPNLSRVRRIFSASLKDTIKELNCNCMSTNAGRILNGGKVSNALVYRDSFGKQSINTVHGFLNTLKSYDGKDVVLPKAKRTKASVMKQFQNNPFGYYIPEINKEGLVVTPLVGSGNTVLDSRCEAFNDKDVTYEQVVEYLKAPFGDKKSDVDFGKLISLSRKTYSAIGTSDFLPKLTEMMDYVASTYPLSFVNIKADKVAENVNENVKKQMEDLFKVPAMLPEANAQTLVSEEMTRMKAEDASELSDERAKLIARIHQEIEKRKEMEKEQENEIQPSEVVGMPKLNVEDFKNSVKEEKVAPDKEEIVDEKTETKEESSQDNNSVKDVEVSKDDKGRIHVTFNIFNFWHKSDKKKKTYVEKKSVPISSSPIKDITTGKPVSESPIQSIEYENIENEKE